VYLSFVIFVSFHFSRTLFIHCMPQFLWIFVILIPQFLETPLPYSSRASVSANVRYSSHASIFRMFVIRYISIFAKIRRYSSYLSIFIFIFPIWTNLSEYPALSKSSQFIHIPNFEFRIKKTIQIILHIMVIYI
jgi:hypothetical protein